MAAREWFPPKADQPMAEDLQKNTRTGVLLIVDGTGLEPVTSTVSR